MEEREGPQTSGLSPDLAEEGGPERLQLYPEKKLLAASSLPHLSARVS